MAAYSGEDPAGTVEIALVVVGFGGDHFADDDFTSRIGGVDDLAVAQVNGRVVGRAAGIGVELILSIHLRKLRLERSSNRGGNIITLKHVL